jgi:hypothetical protein
MKINNQLLANIIEKCFDYSCDGGISDTDRKDFAFWGKRLRGILVNIITAEFDGDSAKFKQANAEIKAVNIRLQEATQVLEQVAETVEQLGKLASILDDLLKTAISFV